MQEMNWKQDVEIDPENLDREWVRQASLFGQYCELLADAHRQLDLKKEKLVMVDAKLGLEIRTNPNKFGLDKVTEAGVNSILVLQEEHKELEKELIDLRYDVEVLTGAVRSLDQKKSALENLVRLHGQNYFAGPEVPHELKKEWIDDAERSASRSKVKSKLNRKGG